MRVTERLEHSRLLLIVGALVIGVVVLVTYHPALQIGFWYDDFNILESVGRFSWREFLTSGLDPRVQTLWYRPIQQIQWRVEYMVFGSDALWYHVIQNLFHLLNCVLLYALIVRLTRNRRAGFVAALAFSVLPVYSLSVHWLAVLDPLAALFYLLAIWLWIDYLENNSWTSFGLTFAAFVTALLSKEVALTLPITLLLVDRWLVTKSTQWRQWALQISPFFLFILIWALLAWNILAGKLVQQSSMSNWIQLFSNMLYYVAALTFPWGIDSPIRYLTLPAVLGVTLYAVATRKPRLLFLGTVGLVSLVPMASSLGIGQRYLYLPLMVSAAGVGVMVEWLYRFVSTRLPNLRLVCLGAFALAIMLISMRDSLTTAEGAENFSALARQTRLQFRPIYQQHPTLAPDTYFYFVEPPFASHNVSGLMFLRYGANVSVGGNDHGGYAGLHNHSTAYVIYRDEENTLKEQRVDPGAVASVSPSLPLRFGSSLLLEGFEVVNTTAKPNEAIVLILYWRTLDKVDKDYTVFAHLMDDKGNVVAGHDSQPHHGSYPTSVWGAGSLNVDAIVVPVTPDVSPGRDYRIEIGFYYLPTQERLPIVDASNNPVNTVIFKSFSVEP